MDSDSYENKIFRMAQDFAEAVSEETAANKTVSDAEYKAGQARSRRIAIEKKLTNCVGANIPRKFVDLPEGVVEITIDAVKLHSVIRAGS